MNSIRRQLIASLALSLCIILALTGIAGYLVSRHEVEELFDAELAGSARLLTELLDAKLDAQTPDAPPLILRAWHASSSEKGLVEELEDNEALPLGHRYEKKLSFQVWDHADRALARSDATPPERLAPAEPGFSNHHVGHHDWRVFSLDTGKRWYLVAERDDVRGELSRKMGIQGLLPLLLVLPLLGWLIRRLIRDNLAKLEHLAEALSQREANRLDPLPEEGLPEELRAIVHAQNHLFDRLRQALERDRRFAADAAHELRTPLAALSIHAQNALRAEREDERRDSLAKMQQGLQRTTHVVEQLLALSRVDATAASGQWLDVDLAGLTRDLLREWQGPHSPAKSVVLHETRAATPVRGNPVLLRSLIRNLIDNALKHGAPENPIEIRVDGLPDGTCYSVIDRGPGMDDEAKRRAFERFFRAQPHASEGSGLGLSIVHQIAERHGARITLRDNVPKGLCVSIQFPPAYAAPQD